MEILCAALGIVSVALIAWGWDAKPKRGWIRIILGVLVFLLGLGLAIAYAVVMIDYINKGGML